MGDMKKAYLMWNQEMKIIHEAKKVKSLYFMADQLNTATKNSLLLVLDYKDSLKKEKALLRIFEN